MPCVSVHVRAWRWCIRKWGSSSKEDFTEKGILELSFVVSIGIF